MDALNLARSQFGITTVYHFFMVPLTIGLSMIVAWFHTRWYRHRREEDLRLTKFFGKLFLINFALGVATGIVQEFQFGMNWASYSRFVGDVFGAPLAMEALVAFFLESTFLGIWIFGWGRVPEKLHLAAIWAAAIGTWLSAYFIIAANSWMQHPVGVIYNPDTGRAELDDIWAVLTNVTTLVAYPHVISGAVMTAGLFVAGISFWYLAKRQPSEVDRRGFNYALRLGLWVTLTAGLGVLISGDRQAKVMFEQQPMKMAAAEALCNSETQAGFSVFAIGDVEHECDVRSWVVPGLLSYLAEGDFDAEVQGLTQLQAEYEELFGPGDYSPSLFVTYWGFRAMMGFGFFGMGVAALSLLWLRGKSEIPDRRWVTPMVIATMVSPFFANAAGWIFTEIGRQPWVVVPNLDGNLDVRLLTRDAVSQSVGSWSVFSTLAGFTLIYALLGVIEIWLLCRYVRAGPDSAMTSMPGSDDDDDPDGDGSGSADDEQFAFAY